MKTTLSLTGEQHAQLKAHLFPGDGLEAVAFALCGRHVDAGVHRLLVQRVELIPHGVCKRAKDLLTWPSEAVVPLLLEANRRGLSVVKIHSHPTGYPEFSRTDDASDKSFFGSVHNWVEHEVLHASAVMLPSGELFGRTVSEAGHFAELSSVAVVGDDLHFWYPEGAGDDQVDETVIRHAQLFGAGTTARLRRLSVAVVGCSGTGSIVIEQLARLGIGRLVLVDPDLVELKNLNRILNTWRVHATAGERKVDVIARAVKEMGFGTEVVPLAMDLHDAKARAAVAGCDVVFGCVDSIDGRNLLNRMATFFLLPYFDVGVKLVADGKGGITEVSGAVHYLQPGRSSLLSRGLYTQKGLEAAYMKHHDPVQYAKLLKEKYIKGVNEDRPAVISVNMLVAAMGVNELLARLHPYRDEPNADFAVTRVSLSGGFTQRAGEPAERCQSLARYVGRGDIQPPLDMPMLSKRSDAS